MTNIIKNFLKISSAMIVGSLMLQNCEPGPDNLGEQFFDPSTIFTEAKNIVAYSISNNDTVRTDLKPLRQGVLGAFNEPVFGLQKASYVTQVRMSAYNPDFGKNAVVDSVVLVLNPYYQADSVTTTTNQNYIYPDGNVPAKLEVKSYPIAKYGKHKLGGVPTVFNIKVHEVTEFMGASTKMYFSNQTFGLNPNVLGSKVFNGKVSSSVITKVSDNSELWKNDVSLRMPLDATFFQNKIIAKKGSPELLDVANFIRYFQGIRISVDENDGYLFQFNPDNASIIMYYKKDVTSGTTVTRQQDKFIFPLVGRDNNETFYNARVGQYTYNRTGTPVANISATPNTTVGDTKLYAQGMGGPSVGIKISKETIQELKNKFNTEKAAILHAKIRLYTDAATWSNKYQKPNNFNITKEGLDGFLPDLAALGGAPNFTFIKAYDLDKNPAYYDILVTKTVKDQVENANSASDIILKLNLGEYLFSGTTPVGFDVTTRPYAMERVVFVGSAESTPQRIQLLLDYAKK